jgi:hypothetical protein
MDNLFIELPLQLDRIMSKDDIKRIDVKKSIHDMIHLTITTSYREVKHDSNFGCDIWKYDFENIYNPQNFKEQLRKSIKDSIQRQEKRLFDIEVKINIEQVEITTLINNRRVKTRISLDIEGVIDRTNEDFQHRETFFIGPLSYY